MSRVLVIAAHPDDEVLGMGGTIAMHAVVRQDAVRIVCVTDGSSTQYPGDAEKRAQKEEEARAAAAELGVTDYVHLDLPDMTCPFAACLRPTGSASKNGFHVPKSSSSR